MPTPTKNRLLTLERKQKKTRRKCKAKKRPGKSAHRPMAAAHKRRARVRAQALDQGEPIELIYNETTESYDSAAMSYEADDAEEMEAEAFDWNEDNQTEAFDWEAEDETEAQAFDLDDAEAFEVEAFEADGEEDSDDDGTASQALSAADLDDDELAEDLDFDDLDTTQDDDEPSRAFSETDFAADLQAIINGEKTYDRDNGGMVSTGGANDEDQMTTAQSAATAEEAPEADGDRHAVFSEMSQHMPHNRLSNAPLAQAKSQAADSGEEVEDPHEVFKALGHNMSHASSFDLGSISMEQTFEDLNEKLDKAEEKIQARAETVQKKANDQEVSTPLALNDAALVDDLDQMHEAMANDDDKSDEDNDANLDDDASNQAMQLAIDGVAYVTKTDKGGAYLHAIETNTAGDITNVKTVKGRVRVPTGAQVLIDTGKTKDDYIWAHHNNKTGAIRKSSVVMLETAAKSGIVVVSDVEVTDQGVQEKRTAPLYRINTPVDLGGPLTQFMKMEEQKTLPLGTKVLVHPNVNSTDSDSIAWAMHVSGADTKVGAVDKGDVHIASQAQYPPVGNSEDFQGLLLACWTTPWLKALYRGFLRTLYNAENLDFLSAVPQISNAAQAKAVLAHFVSDGATQRVNVSYAVKKALVAAITNPPQDHADWRIPFGYDEQSGTTFNERIRGTNACAEIYKLLKQDFYSNRPKFSDQSERTKYIDELKK
ncbi:MAG: hypothetical protein ACR2P1_14400 [Pseudomonadales bacterium]